ncbi:DUF1554 domain-containing protein [Leptospira biflexa]|uniref:DUF1554 domain-containing protein n=1 Tax=Leptospira biflexa TaxID=172 RepID=UPI0010837FEC|nr:DUF1554 domain-containing protein [Leptospira biflexa]TGM37612.1 DUF1554 domain-containing protein [Leptospira biflexa]TGM40948.1 DUF1554 domain-containing protein [Leptospira biflexa]
MRFLFLAFVFLCFQCSPSELNNPSDFKSDSFRESETLLCLTGQTSACQLAIPVCTTCRFFSTNTTYNGARGGIVGADAKCMSDSKKPTEPARAVFKAFLVDDVNRIACTTSNCLTGGVSEHVDWILKPDTTYVRAVDGATIVTTNSVGIFTSQPGDAENPSVTQIITGFDAGGWITRGSGGHCVRWTEGTTGITGLSSSSNLTITGGGNYCVTPTVILCVEQ